MQPFRVSNTQLPANMCRWLEDWVNLGDPGGDFFRAVLENDLRQACRTADAVSALYLVDLVHLIYNYAPAECWGSPNIVSQWIKQKRGTCVA